MKLILSISNVLSRFKLDASNSVYEVNVITSFKNLNNVKLCTPLDVSTLNPDRKIDSIHFI
jgi:hypothetical protein